MVDQALQYAESLINIPYRWYVDQEDSSAFWCGDGDPPSAQEIAETDQAIVCTGLINLIRRKCGFSIPGMHGNIRGKYKELYRLRYPGGTGAWFLYLHQRKRLEKLDTTKVYPRGTLLLAQFQDGEENQGHVAVVFNTTELIHASPDILFADRDKYKNHGYVKLETFSSSNMKSNVYVCYPEHWLLID